MNNNADVISVGIYIYGDELDPSDVSKLTLIEPTKIQVKNGPKIAGRNQNQPAKSGFWIKEFVFKGQDVMAHLVALNDCLQKMQSIEILKINGVDSAHIDIYVGTGIFDKSAQISFSINQAVLSSLANTKLPVMVTFCADEI